MFIQLGLLVVNVCLQSYTFCYTDEFTAVPVPSVRFSIINNYNPFRYLIVSLASFVNSRQFFITDIIYLTLQYLTDFFTSTKAID